MSAVRFLLIAGVLVIAWGGPATDAAAAEAHDAAIASFARAFAGDDSTAKREAVRAVSALGTSFDDVVLALLVQAANDRQTHDEAVVALRARTGLSPNYLNRGSGYPNYPYTDDGRDWSAWLAARTRDQRQWRLLQLEEQQITELQAERASRHQSQTASADAPGQAAASTLSTNTWHAAP
jgi:hypothetical protein